MTTADARLAELAAQIRDHTLCTALLHTAGARGGQPAYSDKMGSGAATRTWTWEGFRNDVLDLAAGLLDHDVARGARVAIMLPNRVEHVTADAAAVHAGCVPVSIYPTLSSEQVAEVVAACSPAVLIVESDAHLARWRPALDSSGIELIIVLDENVAIRDSRIISWQSVLRDGVNRRAFSADGRELRWRTVRPDDPLTIIFTSAPPVRQRASYSRMKTSSTRSTPSLPPTAWTTPVRRSPTCRSPTSPSGSSVCICRSRTADTCD
jgi:long-chain acyl-CoA synthetase